MSCSNCDKTKPILSCVTSLTIGTCAYNSTALYVYVRNNTTGRLYRLTTTSSGAGLIVVTTIADIQMIPDHNYEVWVTLASATNIDERIDITIDAAVKTCLDVAIQTVFNSSDVLQSGSQTLKLA